MTNAEIHEHICAIDGVQKAQLVALRALLRSAPEAQERLRRYVEHLQAAGGDPSLEKDVNEVFIATLLQLAT